MAFVIDNKDTILAIIDGWSGKLTYDLLSQKLQSELGLKSFPSRHTYLKHDEIKHAFDLKKEELRSKKSTAIEKAKSLFDSADKLSHLLENLDSDDATIAELLKRVEKLERENERLNSENNRLSNQRDVLLERFARWQHNLQKMDGVDMNKLSEMIDIGLPAKNRG
jgi:DNA repair exonuclease SbcCD ATPase subunit|tara:strand:+ start:5449 stop:5946 length:498 start_codon:yes stop_codon:yes gene_type:complete